jgi:hypothetical protein
MRSCKTIYYTRSIISDFLEEHLQVKYLLKNARY